MTDRDRAILSDVASKYKAARQSVRVIAMPARSRRRRGRTAARAPTSPGARRRVAKTLIGMGIPANALETSTGGATYDDRSRPACRQPPRRRHIGS